MPAMPVWAIILVSVLGVVLVALIVIVIIGRNMQKKQEASRADIEAAAQIVSMLIIDKKKLKPADSQLPKMVIEQIPKYARFTKLPIVKARVGSRVMSLIADPQIFDAIPVKTEVKVVVSGIYITEIKYVRGKVEPPKPTKNPFKKLAMKIRQNQTETKEPETKGKKSNKKK